MKKFLFFILLVPLLALAGALRFIPFVTVSSGFTPKSIAGLQLWLDPSDSSTITQSSGITRWADKSGNGNDGTAPGVPAGGTLTLQKPSYAGTINGLNTVTFTAASSQGIVFGSGFGDCGGTQSVYAVFKTTLTSTQNLIGGWPVQDGGVYLETNRFQIGDGTGNVAFGAFTITANIAHLFEGFYGFPASSVAKMVVDSSTLTMSGQAGTVATNHVWTNLASWGVNSGLYFDGQMGEILIYGNVLSNANQTLIHNYLKTKWGTP